MFTTFALNAFSDPKQHRAEAWNTKLLIRELSTPVEWKQKIYLGAVKTAMTWGVKILDSR